MALDRLCVPLSIADEMRAELSKAAAVCALLNGMPRNARHKHNGAVAGSVDQTS